MKLKDVPVTNEYLVVFFDELMCLPLEGEIEFNIDLIHGTTSILKKHYRMAPAEFKKLKLQLQDLLERDLYKKVTSLEAF